MVQPFQDQIPPAPPKPPKKQVRADVAGDGVPSSFRCNACGGKLGVIDSRVRYIGITVRRKRYGCEVCGARQNGVEILLGADKEYGDYSIWAQLAAKMPAETLLSEIRDRISRGTKNA